MTIKQFIENSLNLIQDLFPNATMAYEHKENSDTHFIKILPESAYQDDKFVDLEHELNDSFYSHGFEGDICFITCGALTELTNPSIIKTPRVQKSSDFDFATDLGKIVEQSTLKVKMISTQNNSSSFRFNSTGIPSNTLETSNKVLFNHKSSECNEKITSDHAGNRNFAMAA